MGIQDTILKSIGVFAGAAKAKQFQEQSTERLGLEKERLELNKQVEQRRQEESSSRQAYQQGVGSLKSQQARQLKNINDLDVMAIKALKAAQKDQQMRMKQKGLRKDIRDLRKEISNG